MICSDLILVLETAVTTFSVVAAADIKAISRYVSNLVSSPDVVFRREVWVIKHLCIKVWKLTV